MIDQAKYIERIKREHAAIVGRCGICSGTGLTHKPGSGLDDAALEPEAERCECWKRWKVVCGYLKASLPKEFWGVQSVKFQYNKLMFQQVRIYRASLDRALEHGLGYLFLGDNGSGKTSAAMLILISALTAGYTAYYTTFNQLIIDIQAGFKSDEIKKAVADAMNSDFVVIDELDHEYKRSDSDFAPKQLDAYLRRRRGDLLSTILISNCGQDELGELYGPSVMSLIRAQAKTLVFEPGDYRRVQGHDWDKLLNGGADAK